MEALVLFGLPELDSLKDCARHAGDAPWSNRIDADPVAGEFEACDNREGRDARLGGSIVRLAGVPLKPRARNGVDDRSPDLVTGFGSRPPVSTRVPGNRERQIGRANVRPPVPP